MKTLATSAAPLGLLRERKFARGLGQREVEREAALAGVMDEKLVVRKPDLGEMRVEMITPYAYMVTYPLNFNGVYDGNEFSNPRTVTSLWVKQKGKWQNRFLVDQERTAEFTVAGN